MKSPSMFSLAALIALCLTLPVVSQAKMNHGEARSFQQERRMDQQAYRQERSADRQQFRGEMQASRQGLATGARREEPQQVGSEIREQKRDHQADRLEEQQDFIQERRQDRLPLQQDIVD